MSVPSVALDAVRTSCHVPVIAAIDFDLPSQLFMQPDTIIAALVFVKMPAMMVAISSTEVRFTGRRHNRLLAVLFQTCSW